MQEENSIITREYPLFNNIVNPQIFDSLTTPKKIELLLQKDIFFYGNDWFRDKLYCQEDFNKIDFSIFEKLDFNINESYKIDNIAIGLNPLVCSEIFKGLCNAIWLCPITISFLDEIKLHISILPKLKDKISYLRKEISKIAPLKLPNLLVEFNWNKNELALASEQPYEILRSNPKFIMEWITGEHYPGGMYIFSNHPNLEGFYSSYQKFIIAQFCLNEIKAIEKLDEQKKSLVNTQDSVDVTKVKRQKNWTNYEFAYFFEKIGLVDKMKASEPSFEAVSEIIAKAIRLNAKNFRERINEINNTSDNDISQNRKKIQEDIDPLIQYFIKSE